MAQKFIQLSEAGRRTNLIKPLRDLMSSQPSSRREIALHIGQIEWLARSALGEHRAGKDGETVVNVTHRRCAGAFVVTNDPALRKLDVACVPRTLIAKHR